MDIVVRLALKDGKTFDLHLINTLRLSWLNQERVTSGQWTTDRKTIIAILTDELSIVKALTNGRIRANGDQQRRQLFE